MRFRQNVTNAKLRHSRQQRSKYNSEYSYREFIRGVTEKLKRVEGILIKLFYFFQQTVVRKKFVPSNKL